MNEEPKMTTWLDLFNLVAQDLDLDNLKSQAKELGIRNVHLYKKPESLIRAIRKAKFAMEEG